MTLTILAFMGALVIAGFVIDKKLINKTQTNDDAQIEYED